jgi:hypothetical protein
MQSTRTMLDESDFFIVLSVKVDMSFPHCKNREVKFLFQFEFIYLVLEFGSRTHINTFFQIFLDIFENG